jgi:hypothetical protein
MPKKTPPKLTAEAKAYFREAGRRGGQKRWKGKTAAARKKTAQKAARARWGKKEKQS